MTNKQTLEKANEAFSDGDYNGLLIYCTEDIRWTYVGDLTLDGKENVREYLSEVQDGSTFRIEKYVEEGENLVATGWIKLKDKDGGITISPVCDVWIFRNGKMAQLIRSFASEKWFDQ